MEPFEGKLDGKGTKTNQIRITLDADAGDVIVGGDGRGGDIKLRDDANAIKIRLDAGGAEEAVGRQAVANILLSGDAGEITLRADAYDHTRLNGAGNLWLGGKKAGGDVFLFEEGVEDNRNADKATIHLDGDAGRITLGANGKEVIRLSGSDGVIAIKSPNGSDGVVLSNFGNLLILGTQGFQGHLFVRDDAGKDTISLDGQTGDIVLQNADCAEEFDVSDPGKIEPGTVMVLDREGKLQPSTQAYDKKVTGVVSGAGEYKPGIVLDRKRSQNDRVPVALVGKVYCKVDAQYSAIEVGDLLTTSPTPGHAMKASDPLKAFGAVIGKAMRTLETGQGLIPMLIALQ